MESIPGQASQRLRLEHILHHSCLLLLCLFLCDFRLGEAKKGEGGKAATTAKDFVVIRLFKLVPYTTQRIILYTHILPCESTRSVCRA
ncbi:hypothetical protein V8F06_002189 [Rhypophila decipiens]